MKALRTINSKRENGLAETSIEDAPQTLKIHDLKDITYMLVLNRLIIGALDYIAMTYITCQLDYILKTHITGHARLHSNDIYHVS